MLTVTRPWWRPRGRSFRPDRFSFFWVVLGSCLWQPSLARADPAVSPTETPVAVRTGNHTGFGRIVFEATGVPRYVVVRNGDHVTVRLPDSLAIAPAEPPPRNVRQIEVVAGGAELVIAAGSGLRYSRIGHRVVVDVLDPPAIVVASKAPAPEKNEKSAQTRRLPLPPIPPVPLANSTEETGLPPGAAAETKPAAPGVTTAKAAEPTAFPASLAPPEHASPEHAADLPPGIPPETANAGPVALTALKLALPPGLAGFSVPFGTGVGAAAFIRGEQALFVFDERRPVDLAALTGDNLLTSASVQLLVAATLVRLILPPGMEAGLQHSASGDWAILLSPAAARREPIHAIPMRAEKGSMLLAAPPAGRSIAVTDPETGALLLVGTIREPGFGVPAERRAAQFLLLASSQGVAVQPISDRLALRPTETGFVLGAFEAAGIDPDPEPMLSVAAGSGVGATALTRRFDFPASRDTELLRRLQAHLSDAAAAPVLARGRPRVAAAQVAIALGLGIEAQSMLANAVQEDPRLANSAEVAGLSAIAAMLAGRNDAADGIDDPRLSGSDEVDFWRAVIEARRHEGLPKAAAAFAATLPLVLAYPTALRDRLLPLALETMALGGEATAAESVLAEDRDNPALRIADGLQKRAGGDIDGALKAFDAAVIGHDRRDRARAGLLATDLRLATHRIDAKHATVQLDAGLFTWRGDDVEFATRLRLAGLRAEGGNPRSALSQLREAEGLFPERKIEVRARLHEVFEAALQQPPGPELAPLEFVALLDENADLLAESPPDASLQARMADRLLSLDLPRRAGPLLEKLIGGTSQEAPRAAFGATLARMRLQEGDGAGAIAALQASSAGVLPEALSTHRRLLFAEASQRLGDTKRALAALADLDTPAANEARAALYEQTRDWPAATAALAVIADDAMTGVSMPNEMQARTLVRLAIAAAQASDEAVMIRLRANPLARTGQGQAADLFRLLTAQPVTGAADLKRSRQEIAMAKTLPAGLRMLEHRVVVP